MRAQPGSTTAQRLHGEAARRVSRVAANESLRAGAARRPRWNVGGARSSWPVHAVERCPPGHRRDRTWALGLICACAERGIRSGRLVQPGLEFWTVSKEAGGTPLAKMELSDFRMPGVMHTARDEGGGRASMAATLGGGRLRRHSRGQDLAARWSPECPLGGSARNPSKPEPYQPRRVP